MNKLLFSFNCLDGDYYLEAIFDETKIVYSIETSIVQLENKSGELPLSVFNELLKKAEIEKWDKEYKPTGSLIEDATKWAVSLQKDDKTYDSKGEEGYWPYHYEKLIEAINLIDTKADYFK